ncbi:hypothetical protein E2C01_084811 [Portunus trituberculatus]|uniref:Uncharacterized protein n=1 Tax=Portunus trituberculatus TaxID=210409 RepID=A0A5B7J550_PORTR|nr:hypothetical protein [Portunus trituberculatus]
MVVGVIVVVTAAMAVVVVCVVVLNIQAANTTTTTTIPQSQGHAPHPHSSRRRSASYARRSPRTRTARRIHTPTHALPTHTTLGRNTHTIRIPFSVIGWAGGRLTAAQGDREERQGGETTEKGRRGRAGGKLCGGRPRGQRARKGVTCLGLSFGVQGLEGSGVSPTRCSFGYTSHPLTVHGVLSPATQEPRVTARYLDNAASTHSVFVPSNSEVLRY